MAEENKNVVDLPIVNGGFSTDKYSWSQTLKDLTVRIPVEKGTRGRDVECKIKEEHLFLKVKGKVLFDEDLFKPILSKDAFWSIEEQCEVVLEMSKKNQMEWWAGVFKNGPRIDPTKVQPETSSLGDLDGETRAMVEKMMFDQRQKQMGLPTSDEIQKQETLKKFMEQHPEMDFSNAKIE